MALPQSIPSSNSARSTAGVGYPSENAPATTTACQRQGAASDSAAMAKVHQHQQQQPQSHQVHQPSYGHYHHPSHHQNGFAQTGAATVGPASSSSNNNLQQYANAPAYGQPFSPYSAPPQQMYFGPPQHPMNAGGSPGPAAYSPEMQAMMHAALQQQHQHWQNQMAAMAAVQQQSNDPRRRAPSLPNNHASPAPAAAGATAQYYPQQPPAFVLQPQAQPFRPHSPGPQNSFNLPHSQHFHHGPSASMSSPMRGPPQPSMSQASPRERAATASAVPASQQYSQQPPQPQFASQQRPASPSGRHPSEQVRRRTESQPNDSRFQPPAALGARGRTESSTSEPRRPSPGHSPSNSIPNIPSPSLGQHPSASALVPPARLRSDSGNTSSSNGSQQQSSSLRSASPTVSDRAPTPTQATGSGRITPTLPSTSSSNRLASLAGPASSQATDDLQPAVRLVNHSSSSSLHAHGAGIPRKASPLSQQSNSSTTPTQDSPFVNGRDGSDDEDGNESDGTASNRPLQLNAAPPRQQGHKATLSNASSGMGSSGSSPHTPSSSNKSIFRTKLRKALSLNELNHNSSSSSLDSNGKQVGRSSLTSNSSSSDTSHSTNEPRTPPNGASPVLPSRFAASSASNLHAGIGRQGSSGTAPGNGNSLPTNAGRRFGLLNSKMNSSTDNISISSTVSSASVMLRKMGNLGKLARKSSVRSLSNIFHRGEKSGDGNSGGVSSDAVSEFGVPGASMTNSKDTRKKGGLADPTVAHVTVELESGAAAGMTPAEALVRKHQEKERVQREAEEAKRRAAAAAALAAGGDSPKSKLLEKEKEKLKNASAANNSGRKLGDKKKWGFGGFTRSSSSTSLRQDALNASTSASVTIAARANTPSPPSSAAPSPVFDSPNMSAQGSTSSIEHKEHAGPDPASRPSLDGIQFDTWRKGASPARFATDDDEDDEGFDDRTPRQSVEILGDNGAGPYDDWDGEPPNGASFFDDDTASFTNGSGTMHAEPEEYDDGGHDGRSGQKIPERPSRHAKPAKGILKYARSYSQADLMKPQPTFMRPRASSYDAPHQTSPPNQPGKLAALAQVIPSYDQVDGVATHTPTSARLDTQAHSTDSFARATGDNFSPASPTGNGGNGHNMPYSNASFNTSAPILSNLSSAPMTARAMTGPQMKRRISFAHNLSVHTTWAGNIYDRRGEPATCNKLTPQLAQRIKEELNAFKMEEMEVHHMSRNLTHFFV